MTALEYCIKYDFVAALNDKEHGKSEKEEFKAFERVVFLLLSISKKKSIDWLSYLLIRFSFGKVLNSLLYLKWTKK